MAIVYKGRVFSVEVERRRFPNGREHEVAIVRHPPSVVLVPIADDGRVILIRQYRASVGREMWEVPAGSVDEGETPDQAAVQCKSIRFPIQTSRVSCQGPGITRGGSGFRE